MSLFPIDFYNPDRCIIYETMRDYKNLFLSVERHLLKQSEICGFDIPVNNSIMHNVHNVVASNQLFDSEYKSWIEDKIPYEIVQEHSEFEGECSQFVAYKLNIVFPEDITLFPCVNANDFQVNDIVVYYSYLTGSREIAHFGLLESFVSDEFVVISKFGTDGKVYRHGLHSLLPWYGVSFSVRRPLS